MMDGWYDGMGAGGWILMSLFWVGLIAAIVWAGAQLFARPGVVDRVEGASERPEEILGRRLARGEIDAGTYQALRDKLREAS
ncbi:MAG: hypothetical protein WKF65_14825 [Gaiellaceae bacterium]